MSASALRPVALGALARAATVRMHGFGPAILASAICLAAATTPSQAAILVNHGITYSLTGTAITATHDQFTLFISGINGATDDEGGRAGVHAFAFTKPANFSTATAAGFTFHDGGLNSGGCDGSGNFFCFDHAQASSPALPANSTLSFVFDVFITSGSFLTWTPDFKIDWVGTKRNYDLVSLPLIPTFLPPGGNPPGEVPLPGALPLFMGGLAAFGLMMRRRKPKMAAA